MLAIRVYALQLIYAVDCVMYDYIIPLDHCLSGDMASFAI